MILYISHGLLHLECRIVSLAYHLQETTRFFKAQPHPQNLLDKQTVLYHTLRELLTLVNCQGRIQDFKLGGALKIIARSGARRENFGGISCEKSRFYAK